MREKTTSAIDMRRSAGRFVGGGIAAIVALLALAWLAARVAIVLFTTIIVLNLTRGILQSLWFAVRPWFAWLGDVGEVTLGWLRARKRQREETEQARIREREAEERQRRANRLARLQGTDRQGFVPLDDFRHDQVSRGCAVALVPAVPASAGAGRSPRGSSGCTALRRLAQGAGSRTEDQIGLSMVSTSCRASSSMPV